MIAPEWNRVSRDAVPGLRSRRLVPCQYRRHRRHLLSHRTPEAEIGLSDGERVGTSKLIRDHVTDWIVALTAKGTSRRHAEPLRARVSRVFDGYRFTYFSDLTATRLLTFLSDPRAGTQDRRGVSARTSNVLLAVTKQFRR
jgi:hypothetical protein